MSTGRPLLLDEIQRGHVPINLLALWTRLQLDGAMFKYIIDSTFSSSDECTGPWDTKPTSQPSKAKYLR